MKKQKDWKKYFDWRYFLDILKINFKDERERYFCENCGVSGYIRENIEHIIKEFKLEKDDKVILDKNLLFLISLALVWDVSQYYRDMLTLEK